MEPKDVSKRHFYISMVKSAIRFVAGAALITGDVPVAGAMFIVAEALGIAEEL